MKKQVKERMTMIVVTHKMEFAKEVANRAIFMDNGKIIEYGHLDALFTYPQFNRTKTFLTRILK